MISTDLRPKGRKTAAWLAAGFIGAVATIAGPAAAAVIHDLPGGTQLSFAGEFQSKRLDDGRMTRDYDGFTFAASPAPRTTNNYVNTSASSFDYGANGVYTGPLITMSGYDKALFEFSFDQKQSAVLFDLNWLAPLSGVAPTIVLSIYDDQNHLLEATSLDRLTAAHGLVGFGGRGAADISRLTILGNAFGLRNMSVSNAIPQAAVPEPASWALMLTGFVAVGGAVRRRRRLRFA